MAVKTEDLLDLLSSTQNDLPKQEFEFVYDNNDYEFCRIYQNERLVIDGGTNIERRVGFDPVGNARYRQMYDTDTPKVGNVLHTISVPWCQISGSFSWDRFEILQNKNSAKGFLNLMKVKRLAGLVDLANLIEERAWKTPNSASDKLYPNGVPYYLNIKNAAGSVNSSAGFLGATIDYQDGTTGTICAGIDAATEDKWKNYVALYTAIDNAMLKSFRLAFMRTKFKAPIFVQDPNKKQTTKRIYTDDDTVAELMNLADQKDDNHVGKDVLSNLRVDDGGLVTINRLPVVPIPQLTGASYTPIYCIDFAKFIPIVHDGYWMEESEPISGGVGQHTVFTTFIDGAHQNLCINRKTAGFVLHKAS